MAANLFGLYVMPSCCYTNLACYHAVYSNSSFSTLDLFQMGPVGMTPGEAMVTVMMQIITLIVILMMETVVDLVSIENFAQIVYVYLKNPLLQVTKS